MIPTRPSVPASGRQLEGEGILRMLLLAFALALPLASMIYLKIQNMRISYEMGEVRKRIREEDEVLRKLLMERSKYQRSEEIQAFAARSGLQPRKQGHLVPRVFTPEDQRVAKLQGGPAVRF